jgi:LPS-assembly protein
LRQNTLKALRSWGGMSLEASLFGINEANTNASDLNTPLMKLPAIDFTGVLPIGDTSLSFDWNADYVDYWREDGIGAHRVDIRPSISSPIPLGAYLESRAELGVRDTFYLVQTYGEAEWENDDTQNRFLPEFETEVATTFERDFFKGGSANRTLSHRMRPYVQYFYNPDVDQDDLPVFDDVDFVAEKNLIVYGFDNFLDAFTTDSANEEKEREYGFLKIDQSYDLGNLDSDEPFSDIQDSDEPFSDIQARLRWKPVKNASLYYKTFYDVYDNLFNSHTFEGYYTNSRGDSFGLEYSYKDAENIDQINAILRTHIFNNWIIGGEFEHSISNDETAKANVSLIYQALCWSLKFETRYTPADTTYLVLFDLANIGFPLGFEY